MWFINFAQRVGCDKPIDDLQVTRLNIQRHNGTSQSARNTEPAAYYTLMHCLEGKAIEVISMEYQDR